jgi:hypothetical protein
LPRTVAIAGRASASSAPLEKFEAMIEGARLASRELWRNAA